ncbi:MAG: cell division/cell wall cluster transcriptional repressor MraZ [Rickettsiales bacterium]|nr:cell division/cell wall cluster transcriptional repressor MraZ [Rickettsiales bacterium]
MLFLSTYINKLDKKGRTSIPSSFRASLTRDNFLGVVVYESIRSKCIEGCSLNRLEHLSDSIDSLDPYSDERDAFATIILGGSVKLPFDSEGRVTLPDSLIKFANLQKEACFVGKGQTFEIWNPEEYQQHYLKAKKLAMQKREVLKLNKMKL